MKRVLITGGSGFLGARILQQGLGDAELCSLPRGFLAAAGEAEVTETIQKLQPAADLSPIPASFVSLSSNTSVWESSTVTGISKLQSPSYL